MNWKERIDFELKPIGSFSGYTILVYLAFVGAIFVCMHDFSGDIKSVCKPIEEGKIVDFALKQFDIFSSRANSFTGLTLLICGAVLPKGLKLLKEDKITIVHSATIFLLALGVLIALVSWLRMQFYIDKMLCDHMFSYDVLSKSEKPFYISIIFSGYSALFLITTPIHQNPANNQL